MYACSITFFFSFASRIDLRRPLAQGCNFTFRSVRGQNGLNPLGDRRNIGVIGAIGAIG